jgi:hypothetical protein
MTISIKRNELVSTQTRNKLGVRKIGKLLSDGSNNTGKGGGISVGGVIDAAKGLINGLKGFLLGALKLAGSGISFTFSSLWGLFVSGAVTLFNYDFNQTDEDIDSQIKSQWIGYSSIVGGAVGSALGWFTCGVLPTAAIFSFNPKMAAYILATSGDEALDEMTAQVSSVVNAGVRTLSYTYFALEYKNIRKILRDKNSPLRGLIPGIENWGKKRGPVLSVAKFLDDRVESIQNPFLQAAVSSALEEWWDACVDAGFVIAGAADSFIWEQKIKRSVSSQIVEIIPNREAQNETILLSGSKQELKPAITSALATYNLIQNRDIGEIVGYPTNDEIRANVSEITVHVHYSSQKEPPFRVKGSQEVSLKIADVKRSKLDWQDIKNAADKSGYLWGPFLARAKMSNGRVITAYGATSAVAKNRVKEASVLTDADILVINVTEELKEGNRRVNPKLLKKARQVYPVKAVIVVQKISKLGDGKATLDGKNRITESYSFPLWTNNAPYNFEKEVNDLFTFGD